MFCGFRVSRDTRHDALYDSLSNKSTVAFVKRLFWKLAENGQNHEDFIQMTYTRDLRGKLLLKSYYGRTGNHKNKTTVGIKMLHF